MLILDENSLLSAACPIHAFTVQVENFTAMLQSNNLDDVSAEISSLTFNRDIEAYGLRVRITEKMLTDMMTVRLKQAKDTYENVKSECLRILQRNLVPCVLMDKQFGSSISLSSQMTWDDVINAHAECPLSGCTSTDKRLKRHLAQSHPSLPAESFSQALRCHETLLRNDTVPVNCQKSVNILETSELKRLPKDSYIRKKGNYRFCAVCEKLVPICLTI